jgi:hypothetical protein
MFSRLCHFFAGLNSDGLKSHLCWLFPPKNGCLHPPLVVVFPLNGHEGVANISRKMIQMATFSILHGQVLTHLYLLLGCSLPVWLESFQTFQSSRPSGSELRKVAGLLLIGVGDSCAALFGAWAPGTRKCQ